MPTPALRSIILPCLSRSPRMIPSLLSWNGSRRPPSPFRTSAVSAWAALSSPRRSSLKHRHSWERLRNPLWLPALKRRPQLLWLRLRPQKRLPLPLTPRHRPLPVPMWRLPRIRRPQLTKMTMKSEYRFSCGMWLLRIGSFRFI